MSAITNQLPYTPINPPKEPQRAFPALSAVVQRVALAILIAGFCALFGVAFSLSSRVVSLLDPAFTGAIVGLILSLPLLILGNLPTAVESYRQESLEQIEGETSNPRALSALRNLRSFFYYPFYRFSYYHQYALLHSEIAAVTEKLDADRPDVKRAWAKFLKHLHNAPIKFPGGEEVKLDLSFEFSKLQGKPPKVGCKWLTNRFSRPDRESLEEIQAILRESVGRSERFSAVDMEHVVAKNSNSHIVASYDLETQEIVGFGWYFETERGIEIASLARKAPYARLGVGSQLLAQMLKSFDQKKDVMLHVRKSNASAIYLYQKSGFEEVARKSGYYRSDPVEDGIVMKLNWERYREGIS